MKWHTRFKSWKSMNIVGVVDHEWSHFDVEWICKNDIRLLVCLMMIVGPHFALFFFFLFSPPGLFPHACCGANMSFKAHAKKLYDNQMLNLLVC